MPVYITTSIVSVDFNADNVWTDNDLNDGIKLMITNKMGGKGPEYDVIEKLP
jgi:hypothetical protein